MLPSLCLQQKIAAYLDRETSAIDTLISEKESMLGLLEEKRQALVSHAVIQGPLITAAVMGQIKL